MNESHLAACLSMCLAVSAHSATASTPQGASSDFEQGWRQARVVSLLDGSADMPTHVHKDCRGNLANSGPGRYVAVSHSFGGSPKLRRTLIVPVPAQATVKVGDPVRVNVTDCQALAR